MKIIIWRIFPLILICLSLALFLSFLGAFSGHPNKIIYFFMSVFNELFGVPRMYLPIVSMLTSVFLGVGIMIFAVVLWKKGSAVGNLID